MIQVNNILLFILLILASCSCAEDRSSTVNDSEKNGSKESKDSLNTNEATNNKLVKSLTDSIKRDDSIENRNLLIHACEKLINFSNIKIENDLINLKFITDHVDIRTLNNQHLLIVEYDSETSGINAIDLFLLDDNLITLGKGVIMGCHYHNGSIRISDWDNNSRDEIIYRIDWPTQSVAFIEHQEKVYRFTDSYEFENIFEIPLETRDCGPASGEKGILVERSYKFIDSVQIKVSAVEYSIECQDFEWHDKIKNKIIESKTNYLLVWSENKRAFTEATAGYSGLAD